MVLEKAVTCKEQQQNLTEETKCKESVVPEDKVMTQDEEETSDPKEQEDETEEKSHKNGCNDDRVEIDPASEESTAENNKSEDTEDTSLHPVHGEEMDDKILEFQEDAAGKSTDAAGKDEEETAVEADTQPGQGAKNNKEDESSVSEPNEQAEENAVPDNAEAMTATETMEMKAEPSEERETLNCEEAPVTNTEKRQQGDSEERAAASETEVTAENSSSLLEGSRDTTVENRVEASGNNANYESNNDDIKKGEAEEVSAGESRKENQQERYDLEEEQTERSVEKDDKVEEKCEEDGKEQENLKNPDETAESVNIEGRKVIDNEVKTETRVENEMLSELTKSDSNMEGKANEQAENIQNEEVAVEEKADESEKTEKDEDGECVRNENDEEEEKGAATDATSEGEKMSATNKAADEEKNGEAEKEEKDQNESKAEQSEAAKNGDDEKKVETDEDAEGEEILEMAEEPENCADVELSDNVKMLDENVVESDDVVDREAANVACETVMTEEMQTNGMEVVDEKKETEKGSNSENGEIDAENGEISSRAENKSHEDEGEAQSEGKHDVKTEEHIEEEIKTEEPTGDESVEVNEVSVVSEKHKDDKIDQAPVTESEVKEGNVSGEMQEESTNNNWEPETSGTELKAESPSDDRKDCEETKQDENCNLSEPDHENSDLDLIKKNDNIQKNVKVASSVDQEQPSTPIAADLNDTAHKLDDSTEPYKSDKHPHADAAATDLSAVKGENGDPEEASKASEEGASVLLKPAAQSSSITPKEDSVAVGEEIPEALAKEDNIDLVSNWVTMHQASKFFETFVEPLDDLKESGAQVAQSTQSTEHPRSVSPLKMLKPKDENESRDKTREEPIQSELESNHSKGGELCEEDPVKDILQVQETEVTDLIPEAESQQNDKESVKGHDVRPEEHNGSRGSLEEDKDQVGLMQENTEQTDISKTELESIAGTHHSVTSGRPESVSENQTEQKTADDGPDWNEKQTRPAEMKDLLPSSETEEWCEFSTRPEGLSKLKTNELKETREKSREITEITVFRKDGNQEESRLNEAQPKHSDESINGDGRDVRLIQDIQHPLSKDRLSPFSADETPFGRSSYPLLTVARTESEH